MVPQIRNDLKKFARLFLAMRESNANESETVAKIALLL